MGGRSLIIQELVEWCGFTPEYAVEVVSRYSEIVNKGGRNVTVIGTCNRLVRLERKRLSVPDDADFPQEFLR